MKASATMCLFTLSLCRPAGAEQAAGPAPGAPGETADPLKAFCIDFNWGEGGPNGFAPPGLWADASPAEHVAWYEGLGANVIQTFAVSCNGCAWYKGGVVPEQPGLTHDFLTEVVKLGHSKGMRVMGYFCVGANTLWGQQHPELSYGTPSAPHIPLTTTYLDYLCASVADALRKTGMDGFMIDWVWNAGGKWLDCEKTMYQELLGRPFPGPEQLDGAAKLEFDRRAVDRCWTRLRDAAKKASPSCVVWLSCSDLNNPTVVNSRLFREVDWLMNEATDPQSLERVRSMKGAHTRLVQCVVGWGDRHDAKRIVSGTDARQFGLYGFAKPGPSSLPLPIAEYRARPLAGFQGNDRNIAALARYYNGQPLDQVTGQEADGRVVLLPERVNAQGNSPVVMEGQIGHWGNTEDSVNWLVDLEQPGRFEVRIEYACAAGMGGSAFRVCVGDRQFECVSTDTGSWRTYQTTTLGQVDLDRTGTHVVSVKPSTRTPWKALSLRSLVLDPVR
jgi:hypothetical protein